LKVTIIECVLGILALGEKNVLIENALFVKNPRLVAERLENLGNGVIIDELAALIKELQNKGYDHFEFENHKIAENVQEELKVNTSIVSSKKNREFIQENIGRIAHEKDFLEESERIGGWLNQVTIELSKIRVKKAAEKSEHSLIQAIHLIDDLAKTLNLFSGRIREWYGLYFPELDRLIENHETYINLVNKLGKKESFLKQNIMLEGVSGNKAENTANAAETSMGADLSDKDLNQIQSTGIIVLKLYETKKSLEHYVESEASGVVPNLCSLATPLLVARLVALAGGLRNLAMMPSSTIQVLGAEKAMFRSLMSGAKPPKHGIIFHHSLFQNTKRWNRGKVARALAGKLAIAARIDAFSGNYLGEKLKEDLEKRIGEIRKNNEAPPQKSVSRTRKRRRRRKKRY
jgi:nucleolar protein 56